MSIYKKLTNSVIIYGIGTVISKLVALFLVPVYTRVFSEADYGVLEIIQSMLILLMVLGLLQLESAVGRFYYEKEFKEQKSIYISSAFWAILFLSCIITVLGLLFSQDISLLLFETKYWSRTVSYALLTIPLGVLFSFFSVLIRYENKPKHYVVITFTQSIITLVFALLFVLKFKTGIVGVFYSQILGCFFGVLLCCFLFKKNIVLGFSVLVLEKYLSFSLPMLPAVVGNWASGHFSRFIILGFLSLSQIGVYLAAFKIASVMNLLNVSIRMAWHPFLIEQYLNNKNHKLVFKKVMIVVFVSVLLLVVLIFAVTNPLVDTFLPPSFVEAKTVLGFVALSFGFMIISSTINIGPIIRRKTIYNTYSSFVSLLINFGLLYVLVPKFGILGVALSLVSGNLVFLIVSWFFSEKLYPIFIKK